MRCVRVIVRKRKQRSLFAAIGTTWGVGDNLATFNIPDLRGRTLIGAGTATAGGSVSAAKFASGEATPHPLGQYDGAALCEHVLILL